MAGGGGRKNPQLWLIEPRKPVPVKSKPRFDAVAAGLWFACGALTFVSVLVLLGGWS